MTGSDGSTERPWRRWYAPGVIERVNVPESTVSQLLDDAAREFPKRTALAFLGRTMSYEALADAVDTFAGALHEHGVCKGDRVALILPNCPQAVISFFAVLRLGGVVVQHNPLYTPPEFYHQLSDSGATVAICYDGAYARLAEALPGTQVETVIVTSLVDYLPSGKRLALHLPFGSVREKRNQLVSELPPDAPVLHFGKLLKSGKGHAPVTTIEPADDIALLQYTGGTTGAPKGAMLTHRNLVANAYQATAWDPDMQRGQETILAALPIFHVYGLTMCLTVNMLTAGTLVLLPTFDLGLLFAAIDKWHPTIFPGVPPMYDLIVRSRRTGKHDLSSIRTCVSGAMRLPPETVKRFEQVTGGRLVEGYGLTESSPVALANPLNENARPGTIGVPVPGTDAKIVDVEDPSRVLAHGEAGELCIRGPQVFLGYWQQPGETAQMLADGWLRTGDIAIMDDDGFVTLVDRKRDVILASGFSIFPSEIEDVLNAHPAVAESAVVGIPHFYRGETVKAYIVLHEGHSVTEDALQAFCANRLVAYKRPTQFEFRDELPHNVLGKVLRRVLRTEHEEMLAHAAGDREAGIPLAPATPRTEPEPTHWQPPPAPSSEPADPPPAPSYEPADPPPAPPSDDLVSALERLAKLHDAGALTDDEYHAAKLRLLG